MPCYKPIEAWRDPSGNIVFSKQKGDTPFLLSCGRCIGCRLEYSRQWAVRIMHECQMREDNCYVTLTYSPERLPPGGTLVPRDLELFWKRLRKHFRGQTLRYYACGEYGEQFGRPHYHAVIFGVNFSDRVLVKGKRGDFPYYTSEVLDRIWGLGGCIIGEVTFESAAYVARYVLKKVTGDLAEAHYSRVDVETGEVFRLVPEFARMSRRDGIGFSWFRKYGHQVFPRDYVISRYKEAKPPRFYEKLLRRNDRALYDDVKLKRLDDASANWRENTPRRLRDKERVAEGRAAFYRRVL